MMQSVDKPNILLANHLSDENFIAGAEWTLLELGRGLKKHFGVTPFFLSNQVGEASKIAQQFELNSAEFPHPMFWGLLGWIDDIPRRLQQFMLDHQSEQEQLESFFNKNKIGLVIANTIVNVLPAVAATRMRIPVIWYIHDRPFMFASPSVRFYKIHRIPSHMRSINHLFDSYADHLIFCSHQSSRSYQLSKNNERKSKVIYPPIRNNLFREACSFNKPSRNEPFVVGFSGQVVKHKGVMDFLRAAKQLIRDKLPLRFLFAGPTPHADFYAEVQKFIASHGLNHLVEYRGFFTDMADFYRQVDILVMPSRSDEPFGLSAAEAMAFGIPVIATEKSGISELIRNGQNGFVTRKNSRDIAKAIRYLIDNPDHARRISTSAKGTIINALNPETFFQSWLATIRELKYQSTGEPS